MIMALSGPTRPPLSGGQPRCLVILLHGLGADGNDLIGLQQYWGRVLPDAEFISPNAPFPCDMGPYGHQWFSVQDRTPAAVLAGVRAAAPMLDAFIDDELAKNDFRVSPLCEQALQELTTIFYAQRAIWAVSPVTKEAIERHRSKTGPDE